MENTSNLTCLSCNSARVVTGSVTTHRTRKSPPWSWTVPAFTPGKDELRKNYFWPPGLRIWSEPGAVLCLDCGLVWTSVNTEEAEQKLSKYGSDELKSRLGLE